MNLKRILLALIGVTLASSFAHADLSCVVNQEINGSNAGDAEYVYPNVGSKGEFDLNENTLTEMRFDNGGLVYLSNAKKKNLDSSGGWKYMWNSTEDDGVTRVIYSTDGELLIQIFRNYTNQQLGFTEYHLTCK